MFAQCKIPNGDVGGGCLQPNTMHYPGWRLYLEHYTAIILDNVQRALQLFWESRYIRAKSLAYMGAPVDVQAFCMHVPYSHATIAAGQIWSLRPTHTS